MGFKQVTFTFASGATGTNKKYVGSHEAAYIVASAMVDYNAGTNNANITMRGGLSTTDTHVDIQSCLIATHTAKGVYPMPYPGLPYMSIGFGTAVTGSAANSIDVILYSKGGED